MWLAAAPDILQLADTLHRVLVVAADDKYAVGGLAAQLALQANMLVSACSL